MADVAVIIVNYGTMDLAIAAVESVLARDHGGRRVEVHLVDNGSPGEDAAIARRCHEERGWGARVTLYLEAQNHGFGRGNNVALQALAARATPPEYVFLLNPDAQLQNEAIDLLAGFLSTHPEAGAAGTALLRPDGTRVTAAFRFPSLRSEFAGTASVGFISRLLRGKLVALPADIGSQPVDWVTGAAVMFRFSALEKTGFFDPDFFLYFEETELMWRVRAAGYSIWYVSEAEVVHIAGAATGMQGGKHKSRTRPLYWYDSWRLYQVKTRGVPQARLTALACFMAAGVNQAYARLRGKAPDVADRYFSDFSRHVLCPLFLGDPRLARPDGKTIKERAG